MALALPGVQLDEIRIEKDPLSQEVTWCSKSQVTSLQEGVCREASLSGSCSRTLGRMEVVAPHPPGLSVSASIAKGRNIVGLLRGTCYPGCLNTRVQKPLEPRASMFPSKRDSPRHPELFRIA